MKQLLGLLAILLGLVAVDARAWSNHTLVAYRALENMPEVAKAPAVTVEPLVAFLKAEEKAVERLLKSQEAWARENLHPYAPRPDKLEFKADPARADAARRLAFLRALRISPDSRFVLYLQPDPRSAPAGATRLAESAVSTLPDHSNPPLLLVPLQAGDAVRALDVVASASDEPDYGLDINLWQDSPSEWGREYGFGTLPFGNPALSFSTQSPFHMGFYHQDWVVFKAAPFLRRTFPMLRVHQYSSLAELAFRTGHAYWGWRFAGMALHHVQDMTQPFHANLAPGNSTPSLLATNALAMLGWSGPKDELVVLLSNRHLALEKYQHDLMHKAALARQDTALERALRNMQYDVAYPNWSDFYVRDVVALEAYAAGEKTAAAVVAAMPATFVSDPGFDFGVKESGIDLLAVMAGRNVEKRAQLDAVLAELLGHFGAHSRNTLRGILKAAANP